MCWINPILLPNNSHNPDNKKKNTKIKTHIIQLDLNERRSRRDMSPQGRKRVAGMVARDYRTVSGIGQSYHNQVCTYAKLTYHSTIRTEKHNKYVNMDQLRI